MTSAIVCLALAIFHSCSAAPAGGPKNNFVGFYVFPHGGITLDPRHMDYSTQPAFNQPHSQDSAVKLHDAMKKNALHLMQQSPDVIILTTPHGFNIQDNPLLLNSESVYGNAGGEWENFTASFDIEKKLSTVIHKYMKHSGKTPVEFLNLGSGNDVAPILWGEVTPFHFIQHAASKVGREVPKVIYVGTPRAVNIDALNGFGRDLARSALTKKELQDKKIAVVVSGDLSHYHSEDKSAPYPYDASSKEFDGNVVLWAKQNVNSRNIDTGNENLLVKAGDLQAKAGHCGYNGLVILNGMFQELVKQDFTYESHFLAYEVPSYFGMMVVNWSNPPPVETVQDKDLSKLFSSMSF